MKLHLPAKTSTAPAARPVVRITLPAKSGITRVGYNPNRHIAINGGYLEPRFLGADQYGCYTNGGVFLGEETFFQDAVKRTEGAARAALAQGKENA